jgi:hypothetical protein
MAASPFEFQEAHTRPPVIGRSPHAHPAPDHQWSPIAQAAVDFLSRLAATFIGVFFAGLMLMVLARVYVGWEIDRFRANVGNAFKVPPAIQFPNDDPFNPPPAAKKKR